MSPTTITILALGVVSFVLYQVVRVIRRQLEAAVQVRQRLGFVKVDPVDPALIAGIAAIMSPQTGKVKVTKVHKRDQGSHVLYDCFVDHEKNSDSSEHCSILVGRDWRLPSLRLAPRVGGEGTGWSLLNKLTLLAVRQGGYEEVKLENQPEFARKYTALSRTPQEVTGRIPGEVWRDLAAFPEMLFLQAEGDTVIFSTFEDPSHRVRGSYETTETASLNGMMETARRLNSIFENCRSGAGYETARR